MDTLTCLLLGRIDNHVLSIGRVVSVFEGQVLSDRGDFIS